MKDIAQTSSGSMWREAASVEEAAHVGKVTQTAFGIYFKKEREYGTASRYFALGDNFDGIGCVPLEPGRVPVPRWQAFQQPLFVAHMNNDPFPRFDRDISELAVAIGAEITAAHYPYRRPDVDLSAQGQDSDATPGP
jgi:hypothetical protein